MRNALAIALFASALSLAACSGKDENAAAGDNSASAAPVAAVSAPQGTSWTDQVKETAEGGYVMGNPDAAVKLIEYGSYTCPHCAEFNEQAEDTLMKDVEAGKLSYEFRPYMRNALDLAITQLAECGGAEPFFPLTNQLYGEQEELFDRMQKLSDADKKAIDTAPADQKPLVFARQAGLVEFMKERGISEDKAKACLTDEAKAKKLVDLQTAATQKYNIEGTPTFIINGEVQQQVYSWETLKPKLAQMGI